MNISHFSTITPSFGRKKQNSKAQLPPPQINNQQGIAPYVVKGMMIAAPIVGLYQINDNIQRQELTRDFLEEYSQDDTKSLQVKDINDDDVPEYIIEKKDGVKCVYDYAHHDIYFDIDGEKIEKIR